MQFFRVMHQAFVSTAVALAAGHGVDWIVPMQPGELVGPMGGQKMLLHISNQFDQNNCALLSVFQPSTCGRASTWAFVWKDTNYLGGIPGPAALPPERWCDQLNNCGVRVSSWDEEAFCSHWPAAVESGEIEVWVLAACQWHAAP